MRCIISPTFAQVCQIWVSEQTAPRKTTNNTHLSLLYQHWLMSRIFFFLPNWIKGVSSTEKNPLKAVYNLAHKAMTDHNNEFCEWTCLYAPLARGWNFISREWKPLENFIFKRNTGWQRAAAWRYMKHCLEHQTMKPRVFRFYLSLYLSLAF